MIVCVARELRQAAPRTTGDDVDDFAGSVKDSRPSLRPDQTVVARSLHDAAPSPVPTLMQDPGFPRPLHFYPGESTCVSEDRSSKL